MTQNSKVIKIKLEENRQLVDCILLKEPTSAIDFKLLYSKSTPVYKARQINQGTALGWAKILSNNQFISYVKVRYKRADTTSASSLTTPLQNGNNNTDNTDHHNDGDDGDDDDDDNNKNKNKHNANQQKPIFIETHQEAHELPHILCTHFFKDIPLSTLIKTNNIKPPKPNAVIDPNNPPPRLPIVPSYLYAQKRLFVKWRYEITLWWSRHNARLSDKQDKTLTLLQQFTRANPEFRSIQLGKQWFFQLMKQFEQDTKNNITIHSRLETFHKEMKQATEGLRKQVEFVAPTTQRRIDQIREEVKLQQKEKNTTTKLNKNIEQQQPKKSTMNSSDSDSSDSSSSDDDSSSDSSSDSDTDSDESPTRQSVVTKVNPTLTPKQSQPSRKNFDDDDDDSDDSDSSDDDSDDSSSEDDNIVPPKTIAKPTTTITTTKPPARNVVPPSGPQKRKNFDASDSSDTDTDDESDNRNVPIKQVVKRQRR